MEENWPVSEQQIFRIWRREHLQLSLRAPNRKPFRKRQRHQSSLSRRKAKRPNHIWAWDLTVSEDVPGARIEWFALIDEFTRECLVLDTAREFDANIVLGRIERLLADRPAPDYVRSDNDLLWNGDELRSWLGKRRIISLFIAPGAPWENGLVESFFSRFRDECLNQNCIENLREAKAVAQQFQHRYNNRRPHSSLGYLTPCQFAVQARSQEK